MALTQVLDPVTVRVAFGTVKSPGISQVGDVVTSLELDSGQVVSLVLIDSYRSGTMMQKVMHRYGNLMAELRKDQKEWCSGYRCR